MSARFLPAEQNSGVHAPVQGDFAILRIAGQRCRSIPGHAMGLFRENCASYGTSRHRCGDDCKRIVIVSAWEDTKSGSALMPKVCFEVNCANAHAETECRFSACCRTGRDRYPFRPENRESRVLSLLVGLCLREFRGAQNDVSMASTRCRHDGEVSGAAMCLLHVSICARIGPAIADGGREYPVRILRLERNLAVLAEALSSSARWSFEWRVETVINDFGRKGRIDRIAKPVTCSNCPPSSIHTSGRSASAACASPAP